MTWYPSQAVSGQSGELGMLRQSISAPVPIWMGEGQAVLMNVSVGNIHFTGNVILPDSSRLFPENLWNVNVGLNYVRQFDNGWTGMLMTGIGALGDAPFQRSDEINLMLGGTLTIPARNDRDFWNLGVIFSSGGTLNFPIPIVGYNWNPSETFQMTIGLPMSMHWEPADDWSVDMSYVPLTNVNARVTYSAVEKLSFYGGYENITESYFLSDRINSDHRFFVFEQRVICGAQWKFSDHFTADLHAGYAFERRFGEGENQGSSLQDEVTVSPGAFLGLNIRLDF
ncbi:hypothetical protein GC163_08310 [bacterium]|nr:hypothetical protein [bacterium]